MQILISMSRAINPFYLIIPPKVIANLCRGAPNTTEGTEGVFDIFDDITLPMGKVRKVNKKLDSR